jgi:hypothetical protein
MKHPIDFMAPLLDDPFHGHPQDRKILASETHGLRLTDRLPIPWTGSLLEAKVYILESNPGHAPEDVVRDKDDRYRNYWETMLSTGREGMVSFFATDDSKSSKWWMSKLKGLFKSKEEAGHAVCGLQACMYPSENLKQMPPVANKGELPSQRCMVNFLHDFIVRRARDGKCIVACARSKKIWGLENDPERNILVAPNRAGSVSIKTCAGLAIKAFLDAQN